MDLRQKLEKRVADGRHGRARSLVNYPHYEVCEAHKLRLRGLTPEMRIPREKWFDHPFYRKQKQMCDYHVHFREEMLQVMVGIQGAHNLFLDAGGREEDEANRERARAGMMKGLRRTSSIFSKSMEVLNFHVTMEERYLFPEMQKISIIDLSFLYQDHKHLHEAEAKVTSALDVLLQHLLRTMTARSQEYLKQQRSQGQSDSKDDKGDRGDSDEDVKGGQMFLDLIACALEFDTVFMNHLGEEEEIVMPISLTNIIHL